MIDFYCEALKKKEELIYLLGQCIPIKSVYDEKTISAAAPFGEGVESMLNWFQEMGKKDGFTARNIDGHAVHVEYGEGEEYIGIFGHGDVVPEGDGWKTPPYELNIIDNRAYGRGVVDDKGPMLCCYLALKIIKELGLSTRSRIRVILGGNEESGFKCIKHYFKKEPQPKYGFTPDAKFPVIHGEKGAMLLEVKGSIEERDVSISAGMSHNTIPSGIKSSLPLKYGYLKEAFYKYLKERNLKGEFNLTSDNAIIELNGVGGHSSKPYEAVNPITKFIDFLSLNLNEKWTDELGRLIIDGNERGESFNINASGRCGDLTIVPTRINVANGMVSIIFSIRYPESITLDFLKKGMEEYLSKNGINSYHLIFDDMKGPSYVDPQCGLVKKLHEIYIKHTGDTVSKVRTTSAGTYASVMKNSVVFGAETSGGSSGNTHGANEYIDIDKLVQAIGIYAEAMYVLSNM